MSRMIETAAVHFQCSERVMFDPDDVHKQLDEAFERLDGTGVDLVVLCEGIQSRGQLLSEPESIEKPGFFLKSYLDFAERNKCIVAGSLKLLENGRIFNSLVFAAPGGKIPGLYRKTYIISGERKKNFSSGSGATITETIAGKLGGVICFDINFDSLRDEYAALHPDIICFSSMCAGGALVNNWAYKTDSFFVASCKDGASRIIDPLGRVLASSTFYSRIARAKINLDRFSMHWDSDRGKLDQIRRKYGNAIRIDVEPDLCAIELYSESDTVSAKAVAEEFDIPDRATCLNEEIQFRQ